MRLATFTHGGTTRIGVVTEDGIIDLAAARRALTRAGGRLPLADVTLEAPVPRPPKFLAIGLNYADHVRESGLEPPAVPQSPRFLQIGDVVRIEIEKLGTIENPVVAEPEGSLP